MSISRQRRVVIRVGRPSCVDRIVRCLVIVASAYFSSGSAQALIVGTTPNVIPNTAAAPTDNPGFLNSVRTGTFLNGVYIGDGWILSAKHTGVSTVQFEHIATPFQPIPNQAFVVPNPAGMGLTDFTDLRLYRINGDPGLPSLTIASEPPAPGGLIGGEVMFIGTGVTRAAAESQYSVNQSTQPWTWTEVSSGGNYFGYEPSGQGKRWGTNHIADDNAVLNETDANLTAIISGPPGDVISYLTVYDRFSTNPNEAQAVGGNSGSAVYYKRGSEWELTGIIHANLLYSGQSTAAFNPSNTLAIYGNVTAFADLSSYHTQIMSIMSAHADYSIMGDVNLDGVVSGSGTGPVATDDIAAFVAGWRFSNGKATGDITSWKNGDLNRDGKTDAADFLKLRQACTTSGACSPAADATLAALLGVTVPEPTSVALLLFAAGAHYASSRRSRRRR